MKSLTLPSSGEVLRSSSLSLVVGQILSSLPFSSATPELFLNISLLLGHTVGPPPLDPTEHIEWILVVIHPDVVHAVAIGAPMSRKVEEAAHRIEAPIPGVESVVGVVKPDVLSPPDPFAEAIIVHPRVTVELTVDVPMPDHVAPQASVLQRVTALDGMRQLRIDTGEARWVVAELK